MPDLDYRSTGNRDLLSTATDKEKRASSHHKIPLKMCCSYHQSSGRGNNNLHSYVIVYNTYLLYHLEDYCNSPMSQSGQVGPRSSTMNNVLIDYTDYLRN